MITVKYKQRYMKRKLEVSGHAKSAPKGEDLVCAAVSALVITLKTALEVNDIKFHLEVKDGYFLVRCRDISAAPVFHTVMCGMEALQVMYPEFVNVIY